MKKYVNREYNHELFEKQLNEGVLVIDTSNGANIDCSGRHIGVGTGCSDCAFSNEGSCHLTSLANGLEDPVHMRFRETYPEWFI